MIVFNALNAEIFFFSPPIRRLDDRIMDGRIAIVVGFADDAAVHCESVIGKQTDPRKTGMCADQADCLKFIQPSI